MDAVENTNDEATGASAEARHRKPFFSEDDVATAKGSFIGGLFSGLGLGLASAILGGLAFLLTANSKTNAD